MLEEEEENEEGNREQGSLGKKLWQNKSSEKSELFGYGDMEEPDGSRKSYQGYKKEGGKRMKERENRERN